MNPTNTSLRGPCVPVSETAAQQVHGAQQEEQSRDWERGVRGCDLPGRASLERGHLGKSFLEEEKAGVELSRGDPAAV